MFNNCQRKYVAERTQHFLKRIRWKNKWSQVELANNLGMNRTSVSAYENAKVERNKFVRACEVLWELAELEGEYYENFGDFLTYLFQLRSSEKPSEAMSHWENETLSSLNKLSSWIRIRFTEDVLKNKNAERREQLFRILLNVSQLKSEELNSLEIISKSMLKDSKE